MIFGILLVSGCQELGTDPDHGSDLDDTELFDIPLLGQENQVEVITWNVEGFPKFGTTTKSLVKTFIREFSADLYFFQEIENISVFEDLIGELDAYGLAAGSDSHDSGIVLVYRKEMITIDAVSEIATENPFLRYFAYRPPVEVKCEWNNGINEISLTLVNVHLKCCGDGLLEMGNDDDEEFRRYSASQYLYDYILNMTGEDNVIIAGDWNDILTEPEGENVFWSLLSDSNEFLFVDLQIAYGDSSDWSWPGWSSTYGAAHFDHIGINRNLFNEFENEISTVMTIPVEEYFKNGSESYEKYISDHRPVMWTFAP
jgi:exonuclease III